MGNFIGGGVGCRGRGLRGHFFHIMSFMLLPRKRGLVMYILPFLNSQNLLLPIVYYFHKFFVAMVMVAMGNDCSFAGLTPPEGG